MQVAATLVLLVTCELCLAIRVPVAWDESASEVKQEIKNENDEQFSVESFKPHNKNPENVNVDTQDETSIPEEYFQYTAKKPQFAIDVAKFHGVQSPTNHYKAYPIKPYTGKVRPELGKHHLFDQRNEHTIHKPLQEFANINEEVVNHAVPVSSNYEVFHPYEAETPALQEIYKDPILTKIRSDLENTKNRLQTYEKDAGDADIKKNEYLESPDKTDNRFTPHRNVPALYEVHRPQRRPIYYRPVPKHHQREHYLNQRLRHPWNQYSAKIRPMHYRPVKNHIHQLRQNHALKYDDERNEYPQVQILENYSSDPKDGYDIYERGKEKFVQLRNNVDESIDKAVKENRPATFQKLEIQPETHSNDYDDNEEEFVPIKNYAQVRKTETYKHLPRSAALAEADSFDEVRNAPRLREAVKSTKAQTVYSEEGYEDSAYDHAGEQKHASENEGHGGYLKENELSGGKYKTPSESAKYEEEGGSAYRDQVIHAEKWKDDNIDTEAQNDEDDYSEDVQENLDEANRKEDSSIKDVSHRNKRENDIKNDTGIDFSTQINNTEETSVVESRKSNFNIPELNLNSTFLTEKEILELAKLRVETKKDNIKQKYPYYHKNLKAISKHSPLRYAENLKLIPKKSNGGTEFYDSRSKFECPEVDDVPNPLPEKLNHDGHPDNNDDEEDETTSTKGDENYDTANKTPRLKGLGDKIDCFKAKYFGENPLDSPFFKEELISNPEPVTLPNLATYKLRSSFNIDQSKAASQQNTLNISDNQKIVSEPDIFNLIEKLRNEPSELHDSSIRSNNNISLLIGINNTSTVDTHNVKKQSGLYSDVLNNIKNSLKGETVHTNSDRDISKTLLNMTQNPSADNKTYSSYKNKEDIRQLPSVIRKKRSTSFVYEPYKIIREGQVQDSKKTTTSSNISPLIRQLQSSRIVDRVPKFNQEIDQLEKHVKRNVNSRTYKEIDRKHREVGESKNDKSAVNPTFVDISVDSRRGEPRYEIRHTNHKLSYIPVENKKSMSIDEYKFQTSAEKSPKITSKGESNTQRQSSQGTQTIKSKSDKDIHNIGESSNTVKKSISITTATPILQPKKYVELNHSQNEEEYEEYDYNDKADEVVTTTTTQKPSFRRKLRLTTTSENVPESTERPKLKLVTRFRDYKPNESSEAEVSHPERFRIRSSNVKMDQDHDFSDETIPKYREKKKKTTKSTLVTDTKSYGNPNYDDDDMHKKEVDAMIGVNQDMDDYLPLHELQKVNKFHKNTLNKIIDNYHDKKHIDNNSNIKNIKINSNNTKNSDNNEEKYKEDEDEDDDDDDDDDDDTTDDDYHDESDSNEDDEHDDDDEEEDDDNEEDISEEKQQPTTSEPTKRTLAITTDAPMPTFATRNTRPEIKPIVTRTKIEIHKELPGNKSAPHMSQFKQDIKEIEIIKEMPSVRKKKPQKNLEALELYKDDNLAKDVNKLGGVEIFKEGIDLTNGPRHGGNYRSLKDPGTPAQLKDGEKFIKTTKEDAETSQSEFTKHIELEDSRPINKMHGGNFRSLNDASKSRSRGRSSKLVEFNETPSTSMHGGNLKHRDRGRNSGRSQKLIELDDDHDHDDYDQTSDHESISNSGNSGPMHGGNYRSAKIVAQEKPDVTEQPIRSRSKGTRRNSAALLNSFVQVAPILTTTPAYILDPSKRMYYYVDA